MRGDDTKPHIVSAPSAGTCCAMPWWRAAPNVIPRLTCAEPSARSCGATARRLSIPHRLGELMRAIAGYRGDVSTEFALKLLPLTFVRPGELRCAAWDEF